MSRNIYDKIFMVLMELYDNNFKFYPFLITPPYKISEECKIIITKLYRETKKFLFQTFLDTSDICLQKKYQLSLKGFFPLPSTKTEHQRESFCD